MKNRLHPSAQTPEALLNDLRAMVTRAEELVGDSEGADGQDNSGAEDGEAQSARERLGALYAGAKKRVQEVAKGADSNIRSNPYQSLAIALGAGLVVGVLLGRRSK